MRKQPNMMEKLAAAYLSLMEFREGQWRAVLDRIECKSLSAKEICGLFEIDHYPISVFMGGDNHPTNLVPMLKEDHREKTDKIDAKTHAKIRRAEKKAKAPKLRVDESDWKEEATEANKAYRKLIYAERKRKRKANMPKAKWARKREDTQC